jgi:hypothetical protein
MSAAGTGTGHGFTMAMGGGAGSKDIDANEIDALGTWIGTTYPLRLNQAFQRIGGDQQPSNAFRLYFSL